MITVILFSSITLKLSVKVLPPLTCYLKRWDEDVRISLKAYSTLKIYQRVKTFSGYRRRTSVKTIIPLEFAAIIWQAICSPQSPVGLPFFTFCQLEIFSRVWSASPSFVLKEYLASGITQTWRNQWLLERSAIIDFHVPLLAAIINCAWFGGQAGPVFRVRRNNLFAGSQRCMAIPINALPQCQNVSWGVGVCVCSFWIQWGWS